MRERLEYVLALRISAMTSQTIQSRILLQTDFPELTLHARGKVRDLYSVGDQLLFVATDRISAFDCVLSPGIPDKGKVLTQLSVFWFEFLRDITPTHFLTANVDEYPAAARQYRDQLEGRSMLVKRAKMVEVECVARGYLAGSGWKEYRETGAVCGVRLPKGLVDKFKNSCCAAPRQITSVLALVYRSRQRAASGPAPRTSADRRYKPGECPAGAVDTARVRSGSRD